jgi:helicase
VNYIEVPSNRDTTVGLCLDTINKQKQALVFCSTKRAAESQAEKVAKASKDKEVDEQLETLAKQALNVLSNPTKQCKRLALCLQKGVAFHHAGLANKQRELIEDNFREGSISVICSTPTLAAGLDLPAYRAIIRDQKRFGQRGMQPIPVLEYLQMAGRAGRPGKEDEGQAILVANKEQELNELTTRYVYGEAEEIYSKLAVEPVLRTFVLSLVATEVVQTQDDLNNFFDNTFYAYQFRNNKQIHATLSRVISQLQEWEFLEGAKETTSTNDFMSAAQVLSTAKSTSNQTLNATLLGKRVSEMYLDPLTAQVIVSGISKLEDSTQANIQLIHLLNCSLEMRPLLRPRVVNQEELMNFSHDREWLLEEHEFYEFMMEDFQNTIHTTHCFAHWINEASEEYLLETFNVRPGELSSKLQRLDWLCYATEEIARVKQMQPLIKLIRQTRTRLKHGVKRELLALLAFKGIGRVRARKLFTANIKTVGDISSASLEKLESVVGKAQAAKLKEQVGEKKSTSVQERLT